MKKNNTIAGWLLLLALASLNFQRSTCFAQGTAFTYQGQLNANGSTANGLYDLRFQVWDALTNGNLIAGPLTNSATGVTNGLFTITLDFGPGVFTGPGRWLELDVRTNGTGAFTTLLPLQPVLPVPYALYAMTPAGPTGPQGPTGPTGPQGLPGTNGVVSLNGLINAVTLAAGTNVTLTTKGNTLQISAINFIPHMQVFTASGTFMVPAGVSNIMVEIWGGGGGGSSGWTNQGISPTYVPGNGGGGGGYGKQVFNVLPGSNLPVVVGPGGGPDSSGGDSNFNNGAVIAHGGQKGVFGSTGSGGSGGSCNATFNITGAPGGTYQSIYSTMVGGGGAAGCGGFGGNLTINGGVPGGGGGGGAWNYTGGQYISIPAGSGANGRVIINY